LDNFFSSFLSQSALDDIEARSRLYVMGLWFVLVLIVIALLTADQPVGSPYVVVFLALVAAVSERLSVQLSANLSESISLVPILFAAVLFGPLSAMLVAAASFLPGFRRPYLRWASYTASRGVTAAVTGCVALAVASGFSSRLVAVGVATLIGACVSQTIDAAFAAVALRLRRQAGVGETLRTLVPLALSAVPLYAPVVGFLVFAYQDLSPFTLPLFFVPALAAQRLFALYQDQRHLTGQLFDANDALERANLSFASALVATLDARDQYTAGHSAAVAIYARDIAAQLDLPPEQQQLAHVCGLVHDIGKIGLPAGLLEKPGALTFSERREMQRHTEIGETILANVDTYAEIASVARHHHERVDGEGYPDGLVGDQIPILARIISVADAYHAMTSDRPYRDAMPDSVARLRLEEAVGTQLDSTVVAAFEAILETRSEEYRTGHFEEPNTAELSGLLSPNLEEEEPHRELAHAV
jgi:putative nucleotidyltransferase with HDIG domain